MRSAVVVVELTEGDGPSKEQVDAVQAEANKLISSDAPMSTFGDVRAGMPFAALLTSGARVALALQARAYTARSGEIQGLFIQKAPHNQKKKQTSFNIIVGPRASAELRCAALLHAHSLPPAEAAEKLASGESRDKGQKKSSSAAETEAEKPKEAPKAEIKAAAGAAAGAAPAKDAKPAAAGAAEGKGDTKQQPAAADAGQSQADKAFSLWAPGSQTPVQKLTSELIDQIFFPALAAVPLSTAAAAGGAGAAGEAKADTAAASPAKKGKKGKGAAADEKEAAAAKGPAKPNLTPEQEKALRDFIRPKLEQALNTFQNITYTRGFTSVFEKQPDFVNF